MEYDSGFNARLRLSGSLHHANLRLRAWAKPSNDQRLKLCITEEPQQELWLVNPTDEEVLVPHGELCGFNLGSWKDKPTGSAKTHVNDAIPFLMYNDYTYMVHCATQESGEVTKTLRTVADLACFACASAGVTELCLRDHTVTATVED